MAYYINLFLTVSTLCLLMIMIMTAITSQDRSKTHKDSQDWLNHGPGDLYNIRRYGTNKETKISSHSCASDLRLKWESYAEKDKQSAIPAFFNGTLYFPSWNGYINAVKVFGGSLIWKKSLKELTGLNTSTDFVVDWMVSRTTPTIAGDLLIIGIYGPAVVIAVKRSTGELVWSTQLSSNVASVITMSGTYFQGSFYVGTSCLEEGLIIQQYCCTFRGSFLKLNVETGAVLWQTFMLPANNNGGKTGEYAGAAIWGSSPSIDKIRNLVYIATGNLYSAPLRIRQCQEKRNNKTAPTSGTDKCVEPENYSNSIMALDLDSGKIKWYRQLGAWFFKCSSLSTSNCPPGPNPDAHVSEAPIILSNIDYLNGTKGDTVFFLQKSTGYALALDRDDGKIVWFRRGVN